jgi:LPXTG-motif cell wall-anchored protein
MESLTGDEANPFIQLVMIAIVILGLVMFVKKGQRKRKSVWDDEDIPMMEAPMEAPGMDLFGSSDIFAEEVDQLLNSPQIPEDGLPPGWTEEQWQHYGHQYLEMQETSNEQNKE